MIKTSFIVRSNDGYHLPTTIRGEFSTRAAADVLLNELRHNGVDAWVQIVSTKDKETVKEQHT